MIDASQWWKTWSGKDKPVLILGDGPTLIRRGEFDLTPFTTVGVGKVALELPVDIACVFDADAARDGDALTLTAQMVLMPLTLIGALSNPLWLTTLQSQNRLLTYEPNTLSQVGGTTDPEAARALAIFAALGARTLRTLGVDPQGDLTAPTPETTAFSDAIAAVIHKYSLDCGPLTVQTPARVFIGTDPSQALGAKILEYSIRKHSTLSVVFDDMSHVEVPMPKDPRNQPRTQFSFNRFAIPSLCGYQGRGLYLDADMLVLHDLRELYELPFQGSKAMYALPADPKRSPQTSVLLLDCANLDWDVKRIVHDLDECVYDYEGLMRDMKLEPEGTVQGILPPEWNSLEIYEPGRTRLLHYTDMHLQPWVSRKNENLDLWVRTLREALADGFVTEAEVREAVKEGFVRPSILAELKLPPSQWPLVRRTAGSLMDKRYRPHRALQKRLSTAGIGIS